MVWDSTGKDSKKNKEKKFRLGILRENSKLNSKLKLRISTFKIFILLMIVCVIAATNFGCLNREEKLPAIEVCFEHYIAGKTHIIKILYAKPVYIPKSKAPTLHPWYNTPMPGILLFAYDTGGVHTMRELGEKTTPTTWIPINKQGKIITYIGFRSPKDVPKKGDRLLVIVQVVDKYGRTLAEREVTTVWNLSYSP